MGRPRIHDSDQLLAAARALFLGGTAERAFGLTSGS